MPSTKKSGAAWPSACTQIVAYDYSAERLRRLRPAAQIALRSVDGLSSAAAPRPAADRRGLGLRTQRRWCQWKSKRHGRSFSCRLDNHSTVQPADEGLDDLCAEAGGGK